RDWIRKNAQAFAKQEVGGREPTIDEIALAEKRLAQQAAKETDLFWMLTLEKVTDLSAQKFLRQAKGTFTNENGTQQQFFTMQGKQFMRPELFANEVYDLSFYKNHLQSPKNSSISKGTGELARRVTSSTWDKAKQDPILTGLQIAASPVHLVRDVGKASWQCVSGFGQCLQQGKENFVETGSAIGTGTASFQLNDLKPIYGQDVRGAQAGLVALQTADGITTALGAAKALNVAGKGSRYFINEWVSGPPSGSRAAQRGAVGDLSAAKVIEQNLIPNADSVIIDTRKFTDYALNPNHDVGRHKARVFESALGYNQSNATELILKIRQGLKDNPARLGKKDQYGQRYTVDIPITGPNGKTAIVTTGWILVPGSEIPKMTTVLVK
ncbi:DUF6883 domain-containing protein, partial [Kingella negevensis]